MAKGSLESLAEDIAVVRGKVIAFKAAEDKIHAELRIAQDVLKRLEKEYDKLEKRLS